MDVLTWQALVARVRRLADEIAPHDPDAANAAFDVLVALHGRDLAAQALLTVAPTETAHAAAHHHRVPAGTSLIPAQR